MIKDGPEKTKANKIQDIYCLMSKTAMSKGTLNRITVEELNRTWFPEYLDDVMIVAQHECMMSRLSMMSMRSNT